MSHIFLIVEGVAEEMFYKSVFAEHFKRTHTFEVTVMPTKKNGHSRKEKGGMITYDLCLTNLKRYLHSTGHCDKVYLIYDYYGLHNSFLDNYEGDNSLNSKLKYIISRLEKSVNDPKFKFILQVHEFEAFLFSMPEEIAAHFGKSRLIDRFKVILTNFNGDPELINNSSTTAPSKRIIAIIPEYAYGKISDGVVISGKIGIQNIMNKCKRFKEFCDNL